MAYFRLWRRIRIAPGLTVNLSKRGPSVSVGVRGAHVTLGRRGIRKTVGIPGTGMFLTDQKSWKAAGPSTHRVTTSAEPGDRLVTTGSRVTWDGHDVRRADMPEIKAYGAKLLQEAEQEAEELERTNPTAAAEARAVIRASASQLSVEPKKKGWGIFLFVLFCLWVLGHFVGGAPDDVSSAVSDQPSYVGRDLKITGVWKRTPDALTVNGDIFNSGIQPRRVPRLRVSLLDRNKYDLHVSKVIEPPVEQLAAGAHAHFSVVFEHPSIVAQQVAVTTLTSQ